MVQTPESVRLILPTSEFIKFPKTQVYKITDLILLNFRPESTQKIDFMVYDREVHRTQKVLYYRPKTLLDRPLPSSSLDYDILFNPSAFGTPEKYISKSSVCRNEGNIK